GKRSTFLRTCSFNRRVSTPYIRAISLSTITCTLRTTTILLLICSVVRAISAEVVVIAGGMACHAGIAVCDTFSEVCPIGMQGWPVTKLVGYECRFLTMDCMDNMDFF